MTNLIIMKHSEVSIKLLGSIPDVLQVPAKCLGTARRGLAADLSVILTKNCSGKALSFHNNPPCPLGRGKGKTLGHKKLMKGLSPIIS